VKASKLTAKAGEKVYLLDIIQGEDGLQRVQLDGQSHVVDIHPLGDGCYHLLIDGVSHTVSIEKPEPREDGGTSIRVSTRNRAFECALYDTARLNLISRIPKASRESSLTVRSPIPGKVVRIPLKVGQLVEKGMPILLLEAMKMENEIRAPITGRIQKIHVTEGQNVPRRASLLDIEAADPDHA
jgi:biotin carboxyl carrier protein